MLEPPFYVSYATVVYPYDLFFVCCVSWPCRPRRYPDEPPKGKGNRIAASAGTAVSVEVNLPNIGTHYKQRWASAHGLPMPQ